MRLVKTMAAALMLTVLASPAMAAEPDYSEWTRLLQNYYNPAKGMDYSGLKQKEQATLDKLEASMAQVDISKLNPKEQLAYWINLYNISTISLIVDNYPTDSIRSLSTDPIVRFNVFKKAFIPVKGGTKMSLNDVENDKIRDGFKDPRIHFAINCAAKSCPPMRPEAFTGARVDEQLDDQSRKFLNGPGGATIERNGSKAELKVTKVMDWFGKDFDVKGGVVEFTKMYLPADKKKQLEGAKVKVTHYGYDWDLNDWKR